MLKPKLKKIKFSRFSKNTAIVFGGLFGVVGAGDMTSSYSNSSGQYLLAGMVSNQSHRYSFVLKNYTTKSARAVYPAGTVTLNEVLKKD